jgi:hypothetical protein
VASSLPLPGGVVVVVVVVVEVEVMRWFNQPTCVIQQRRDLPRAHA